MNEEDKILLEKFERTINPQLNDDTAVDFFAQLTENEYARLIDIFRNNDFPKIPTEAKEKIVAVLEKMKLRTLEN